MLYDLELENFINNIGSCEKILSDSRIPKNIREKYKAYKYPYKPALMISIMTSTDDVTKLFNNDIHINNEIIKKFYTILMNSEIISEILNCHKYKVGWKIDYNEEIAESVRNVMFGAPIRNLNNNFPEIFKKNGKDKTIRININHNYDCFKLKEYILEKSIQFLNECIPDYIGLNLLGILNYDDLFLNIFNNNMLGDQTLLGYVNGDENEYYNKIKTRKFQNLFRKWLIEDQKKCIICCLDYEPLLEAAHIKPYNQCNENERYDKSNGLVMCRNHHKLFDYGLFKFTDDWKIVISKKLKNPDADLMIKTFEKCYLDSVKKFPNRNVYCKYHSDNIFQDED